MKNLTVVLTALLVAAAALAPASAEAGVVVRTDLIGGGGFEVALQAPALEAQMTPEDDAAREVNPTKERIKGAIKLTIGGGLLAAGSGLTGAGFGALVLSVSTACGASGCGEANTGIYAGIYAAVAIGAFVGAGACIVIGIVLLVEGAGHMKAAEAGARLLIEPEQRYAQRRRSQVTWGFRFAVTPAR